MRDKVIDIVKRTFVGPDPIQGYTQANGEEKISNIHPRTKYVAGVLHPKSMDFVAEVDAEDIELVTEVQAAKEIEAQGEISRFKELRYHDVNKEINEDIVSLANEQQQSSISFTAVVSKDLSSLNVIIEFGVYDMHKEMNQSSGREVLSYYRKGNMVEYVLERGMLPTRSNEIKYFNAYQDDALRKLAFAVTKRYSPALDDGSMYTFSLINITKAPPRPGIYEFYQCKVRVKSDTAFLPLPEDCKLTSDDDFSSNQLLYREVKTYGIGHGCSVAWDSQSHRIHEITTETIPAYEVKSIVPNSLPSIEMSMDFFRKGNRKDIKRALQSFVREYDRWIEERKVELSKLGEKHSEIGNRHIENCIDCSRRISDGIQLLDDDITFQAFRFTNEAMLLQQIHYNIPLKKWELKNNSLELDGNNTLPDIENPDTWYGDKSRYGRWRPFQLAFLLMNFESMLDSFSDSRSIIDLIWFPTGGGKTEAYLGLSAFTILSRKLKDRDSVGNDVLMRYTLRLLTTQQYERAASLVCSLEYIRKQNPHLLGENRITIGLWVGDSLSDNTTEKALANLKEFEKKQNAENRFLILKCPWCGAEMGKVEGKGGHFRIAGYAKIIGKKKFGYVCSNKKCHYSEHHNPLPLELIDDQIYNDPPNIIIGTVDKFAILPFKPEAKAIFGIRPNGSLDKPPALFIQDELHLISGPLGSMVGFYEFLIKELCGRTVGNRRYFPKIIASTATISNAKQQCRDLYGVSKEQVFQFPPQGLSYRDSFFAKEDSASNGRKYVGLNIPDSSTASADIRLYASLLYAGRAMRLLDEKHSDSYWTILAYFNSLKDLGQTKTWIDAAISDNLSSLYVYRKDHEKEGYKNTRRYINHVEELTSRVQNADISRILQSLSTSVSLENPREAVDICLASNMISVGIDIPRLSLMTVSGQPKTTSEYIQATSRVGRGKYPGLVFTHYYHTRPRDKSHYEQFQSYHSKIYSYVEPTSATPFSPEVRRRALHAVLVAYYRIMKDAENPATVPEKDFLDEFSNLLQERIRVVDPNEWKDAQKEVDRLIREWSDIRPQIYSTYTNTQEIPLIYSSGIVPNVEWGGKGWPTQSSMRSVDLMCKPQLVRLEDGHE